MSPLDKDVSARIAMLRYPLMYMIVVVHTPWLVSYAADPNIKTFIGSFFVSAFVKVSVPTLTCISAFLIFHTGLDRDFKLLIRKRTAALLVPMIIWNLPLVLLLYFVQASEVTAYEFNRSAQMYPFDLMQWLNGVFAITQFPIVGPMHFMRDLYIVSFLAPLMGWVIRRAPVAGFIVILAIFYPGLDGALMRNDSIPIAFYIGAWAAVKNWNLKRWDTYAWPIGAALVLICCAVVVLEIRDPVWLWVIAPFMAWPLASKLVRTRLGRWFARQGQAAVFLFMFHGLVLIFLLRAFPHYNKGEFEFLIWLVGPLLITLLSQQVYLFLRKYLPGLLSWLLGGRKPVKRVVL